MYRESYVLLFASDSVTPVNSFYEKPAQHDRTDALDAATINYVQCTAGA